MGKKTKAKKKGATQGQRRGETYKKFSKVKDNEAGVMTDSVKPSNECPKCEDCEIQPYQKGATYVSNLCINCKLGINGHKKMAKPQPKK